MQSENIARVGRHGIAPARTSRNTSIAQSWTAVPSPIRLASLLLLVAYYSGEDV
jgi:hypothetical protein